jgi:hypothetical protein
VDHPRFKDGSRSKYLKHLPKELKGHYRDALADEQLLSLRDELGVLTARAMQLMGRLGQTEAPPWGRAVEALNDFKLAVGAKDADRFRTTLAALEDVIRMGAGAAQAHAEIWQELRAVIREKTRTAGAEWKRLNDLQGVVTVDKALGFAKALLEAAREVIQDRDLLRALQERTRRLLPPPDEVAG